MYMYSEHQVLKLLDSLDLFRLPPGSKDQDLLLIDSVHKVHIVHN